MTGFVVPPGGPPGFGGPIIDDPALLQQLLTGFRIGGGPVRPFALSQVAVPIIDLGRVASVDFVQDVTTPGSETSVRIGTAAPTTSLPVAPPRLDTGAWDDGGFFTNPASGTILADTGAQTSDILLMGAIMGDGQLEAELQWRNAANDGTVANLSYLVDAGQPAVIPPMMVNLAVNERVRVRTQVNATGRFSANLIAVVAVASGA